MTAKLHLYFHFELTKEEIHSQMVSLLMWHGNDMCVHACSDVLVKVIKRLVAK